MEKEFSEKYLTSKLEAAIMSEEVAGHFYKYIADRVEDVYVKQRFKRFSFDETKKHKDMLNKRLRKITGKVYEPNVMDMPVDITVKEFSLHGAVKMAKASESQAIEFYKAARLYDKPAFKALYEEIMEDEKGHRLYLEQGRLFTEKPVVYNDALGLKLFSMLANIFLVW